jgi:hypothetical protein
MSMVLPFDHMMTIRDPARWCDELFAAQKSAWEDRLSRTSERDISVRLMCLEELLAISVHGLSAAILMCARNRDCVAMYGLALTFWVYACSPDGTERRAMCTDIQAALTQTVEEIHQKGGNQSMLDLCRNSIAPLVQSLSQLD